MNAEYAMITAFVRAETLEKVERALQDQRVSGVSISRVKGYGEYADFFSSDWMSSHVRIEVITDHGRAQTVVDALLAAASTGNKGDGIVAVTPIDRVWRVRTGSVVPPSELS